MTFSMNRSLKMFSFSAFLLLLKSKLKRNFVTNKKGNKNVTIEAFPTFTCLSFTFLNGKKNKFSSECQQKEFCDLVKINSL